MKKEGSYSIYECSDASDSKVASFYDDLLAKGYDSNEIRNDYKHAVARVIDQYNLLKHNCSTTSLEGLAKGGSSIKSDKVKPSSVNKDVSEQAKKNVFIKEIEDPETYIQFLISNL